MEVITRKNLLEIEVKGNKYLLGFPTRPDAIKAEEAGLDIVNVKLLSMQEILFYAGLLAKQPEITREKADEIMEQYFEEGGDLAEITQFLIEQYVYYTKNSNKKRAKIVKI